MLFAQLAESKSKSRSISSVITTCASNVLRNCWQSIAKGTDYTYSANTRGSIGWLVQAARDPQSHMTYDTWLLATLSTMKICTWRPNTYRISQKSKSSLHVLTWQKIRKQILPWWSMPVRSPASIVIRKEDHPITNNRRQSHQKPLPSRHQSNAAVTTTHLNISVSKTRVSFVRSA